MDGDQRNWEDQSEEDLSIIARIADPLAELAAEIAICVQAIENGQGSFCADCKCIGYHLPVDNSECEFCGCYDIHWTCSSCGESRPIEMFEVGSKECKYCISRPPIKIKSAVVVATRSNPADFQRDTRIYDRNREARLILAELTE